MLRHFEPRLPDYHIDKESLDLAFTEMANDLSEDDRNKLSQKAAKNVSISKVTRTSKNHR